MTISRRAALRSWELAAFALAVVAGRILALSASAPSAAGWVDLRYAQNLARGRGFVFTPGAAWEPTSGAATPGFVGLLGALAQGFGGALEGAQALGVLADTVSVLLIALVLGGRPWAARASLLGFALLPAFLLEPGTAGAGPLAWMLVLAAVGALGAGRVAWSGAWAGLATVLRPELGLLAPGLAALGRGKRQLALILPTTLALGGFLLWIKRGFDPGWWIAPLTRMGLSDASWLERWSEVARAGMGGVTGILLAPLAIYGLYRVLQVRDGKLSALVLCSLGLVIAGTITAVAADDASLHVVRGTWLLLTGLGLDGVASKVAPLSLRWFAAPAALAGAVLLALLTPSAASPLPDQESLLEWANDADLDGRVLFARDGAALAYLTDARVLASDGGGLPLGRTPAEHQEVLRSLRPDYLLLEVAREGLGLVYGDDELSRGYYPVRRFSRSGERERNPSAAGLPRRAPLDLLLLRRHGNPPR